jgi:SAM-dependent methyltransferase
MSSISSLFRKIPGAIRYRRRKWMSRLAVLRDWRRHLSRLAEVILIERRYGIDVSGYVYLEDMGVGITERVWYHPSEWLAMRSVIRSLGVSTHDVFIDIGSGKGGAVFVAARYFPFKRVMGVEISGDLNRIARANIAGNLADLRCKNVELVTSDVLEYPIPEDLSVVYLFSPVVGETFHRLIDRLLESLDRNPRVLRLLYNYPVEHDYLVRHARVRVIDACPSSWLSGNRLSDETIVTYLLMPRTPFHAAEELIRQSASRLRGAEAWLGPYNPGFRLESRDYTIQRGDDGQSWEILDR